MHLKKIKLAGFKSFVDPTTVLIPSQLVAVVGPNGCGKSNIIDAVSWVMGESSAKYLRGESLTDVIFNGSTSRKPVGQASVELVFDNQDGTLGGEYAAYAEISIRRVITREAESSYYLNGTRCRRKDIIDIFLGTGLGPRSYSIIGQNMIARIIEAKPDDMRTYLEEAAGVSKYKERRRETEIRIRHTKENLARLADVTTELEKQLGNLKRQSNAAEKYKELKEEERTVRSEWLVIQWRELDSRLVQSTLEIQQQETGLESRQAMLTELNLGMEEQREAQIVASDIFQDVQRRYYAVGSEITRVEQEIRHTEERQRQWRFDMEQVEKDWTTVNDTIAEVIDEREQLSTDIAILEPEWQKATQAATIGQNDMAHAEDTLHEWQTRWEAFNQSTAKTAQTAQVEQTRIQHLEQRLTSIKQRQQKIAAEQQQINVSQLSEEVARLLEQAEAMKQEVAEQEEKVLAARDQIHSLQQSKQQHISQLDQVKNQLQRARGQQASLEALQQTALGQRNNEVVSWLAKHGLDKAPRLAQGIEVEAGWEGAVEKILKLHLQAICVDQLDNASGWIADFNAGNLSIFATEAQHKSSQAKPNALANKIKSSWPIDGLLAGIYTAETHEEALALASSLEPHESIVTRDGVCFGASWLEVNRDNNPESGVFQREQELKQLAKQITELTLSQEELESHIEQHEQQIEDLELNREDLQKAVNQIRARSAEMNAQQKMQQQRMSDLEQRADQFAKEQEESAAQSEEAQLALTDAKNQWQQAMTELEQQADTRDALTQEREEFRTKLQTAREKLQQTKELAHQQEIKLQASKSQQSGLQQNLVRLQAQFDMLTERKELLQKDELPTSLVSDFEKTLEVALNQRLQLEDELQDARSKLSSIEQALRTSEQRRQEIEREAAKFRDMLETLRVESQGTKVKCETLLEQITETGLILEEILKTLPEEDLVAAEWQARLEQIMQRITRLGPINLVAIEEHASCLERKDYLDKQCADLNEGLATLEDAIAKIDKETRARFKETFDKVNERFQELFPKIFGGGRAYLELTGEELLDAGISVMACPPGKRNSTIHLLSGGEKAMTAISLVFSIFHLNPAPFCLLDEVDAPLDDANIGRFCQLVKDMSERTQFIFISHNKLAIEMGQHLMGVTMHEPGVSRLVSVNMEEAVSLAGA